MTACEAEMKQEEKPPKVTPSTVDGKMMVQCITGEKSNETEALVAKVKGKKSTVLTKKVSKEIEISSPRTGAGKVYKVDRGMSNDATTSKVKVKETKDIDIPKTVPLPPPPPTSQVPRPTASSELVNAIKMLLDHSEELYPPRFEFDTSCKATQKNFQLLKENNFNLNSITQEGPKSVLTYGSEFKSTELLNQLLHHHPRWTTLRELLDKGAQFPLESISESERLNDLMGRIAKGNHKSASENADFLADALKKEIQRGWILPLPVEAAMEIPNMEMAPLGVATHLGINADGEFIPKMRVTHDLSFPGEYTESSINSRVVEEDLEPCMFGYMLLRLIHYIVSLRRRYPDKKIWLRKEDFKSAFRRVHLHSSTALKSVVRMIIDDIDMILVSLRLPFGGAPCPSGFCLVSDVLTDVINDLLNDETWDHEATKGAFVTKIPQAKPLQNDITFEPGLEVSVEMPDDCKGKADVYIDDIISCTVDEGDNLRRLEIAPCTVLEAVAHNATGDTFIKRQHFISDEKNEAEGAAEEIKICLGWEINTRSLTIALPSHKFIAWSGEITRVINSKSVNNKTLQSVLGRLETVATMLAPLGHFLNNIRNLQIKAETKSHAVSIPKGVVKDLQLAKQFIKRAHEGINMNLITFRKPTLIFIGDASEHGLGGFDNNGRAWRYHIPEELQGRAHINLLEFLTQVVGIWLAVEEGRLQRLDCVLAMGDSTTALGWLRRANFKASDENNEDWVAKQTVARKLGSISLDAEITIYKQWFKGDHNVVADSLSRDVFYLSIPAHEKFLSLTTPSQLPSNFQIHPLPARICSFISSTLRLLPVRAPRLKPQKASELARGNLGMLSYILSGLKAHHSSRGVTTSNETLLSPPSPRLSERVLSLAEIENHWWRGQSTPPSPMWLRPLGQATGKTPDWTQTGECASS